MANTAKAVETAPVSNEVIKGGETKMKLSIVKGSTNTARISGLNLPELQKVFDYKNGSLALINEETRSQEFLVTLSPKSSITTDGITLNLKDAVDDVILITTTCKDQNELKILLSLVKSKFEDTINTATKEVKQIMDDATSIEVE